MDDEDREEQAFIFVSAIKWVQRGVAKPQPDKVKLDREELARLIKETNAELKELDNEDDEDGQSDEDAMNGESGEAKENVKLRESENIKVEEDSEKSETIESKYDLDNYDDDEDAATHLHFGDVISFSAPGEEDLLDPDMSDEESDVEDITIKPSDNLLLLGHVEGEAASLDVYVYNDVEDVFYVHHDIPLPSFPLAIEWLNYEPGEETAGNLAAVGSMQPVIQVWDLDIINCTEPAFELGRKGKKKKKVVKGFGHKDAVLALSWNKNVGHVLASGGVDKKVLLWDLNRENSPESVALTIGSHTDKVQALQWHPVEQHILLTGCCDGYARVFDCKSGDSCKSWKVQGEVERVLWNHFNPYTFLACSDSGHVMAFDVRTETKPLWTLHAHDEGVNGLSLSSQCPDCIVTVSSDSRFKVWDIADGKPSCVAERDMAMGKLQCSDFCPDAPFVVGLGGDRSSNFVKVTDIRDFLTVRNRFGERKLQNPYGYADFGYSTAGEADEENSMDVKTEAEQASSAMEAMSLQKPATASKGAVGKFKKEKKKKKKDF